MFNIFVPHTLARAGQVNTNFSQLKDKEFIIPYYEITTGLNASSWTITATFQVYGYISLNDACEIADKTTGEKIIIGGKVIVGKITDTVLNVVTFYKEDDLMTPITLSQDIRITFPVYSTFEKLPADALTREFQNSYQIDVTAISEDFSTTCNGIVATFTLSYVPMTNSIDVIKNSSLILIEGISNDYTVSTQAVVLSEPPLTGNSLIIKYLVTSAII